MQPAQATSSPPKPDPKPEKVTQLQCGGLDEEFRSIFTSSIMSALKYYPAFASRFRAEIELIVHSFYFYMTIFSDKVEPGNALQNITYCSTKYSLCYRRNEAISKTHKTGLFVLDILVPYLRKKLEGCSLGWVVRLVQLLGVLCKILQYINLVLFISEGRYRNLTQRLLGIEMKFINPKVSRLLDFSLMNRQLLWSIYESFLSTVLPFLKKTLSSNIKKIVYLYSYVDPGADTRSCMVCGEDEVTLPQTNDGCQHVACFYCMKTITAGKDKFYCSTCGKEFTHWKPQAA